MNTQHLTSSPDDLQYAAKLLQSGQIVGMPTETAVSYTHLTLPTKLEV